MMNADVWFEVPRPIDAIVEAYLPYAETKARLYAAKVHGDWRNFYGAAWEGLRDAVIKFDPDKGFKFGTYASMRIWGAIIDYVRTTAWTKRNSNPGQIGYGTKQLFTPASLDDRRVTDLDGESAASQIPARDDITERLSLAKERVAELLSKLSPRERRFCELYMLTGTHVGVARCLDRTQSLSVQAFKKISKERSIS